MRWLIPRLLLGTLLLTVATPVEAAVPLVRMARGTRGVQSGPAIASLLSVATGLALVARLERHPESSALDDQPFTALLIGAAALPTVASTLPMTVVGRQGSPLWGWALWGGVRVATAFALAEGVDRAKRRLDVGVP